MRTRPPVPREVLSFINFAAREINCKIVYYGAGLGGKTTNLQFIYQKTAEQQKGKMISLATETERPCFLIFCLWTWARYEASRPFTHVPGRCSTMPAEN
jgi:hypothetical protein